MAKRDEEREKRLAEALRENLRRRKAQARGRRRGALTLPPRLTPGGPLPLPLRERGEVGARLTNPSPCRGEGGPIAQQWEGEGSQSGAQPASSQAFASPSSCGPTISSTFE
jgi:hypothetical protein